MPQITDAGRKWWTLIAAGLALFVVNVDFWGVTVLLPSIARDFDVETPTLEWVINAFLLMFAPPLLAVGRLGDLIGRRKVLVIGLAIFAVASFGCALSSDIVWLIVWRAIQGAGAALYFANSLAIVSNAFPPRQRGLGIGLWVSVGLIGGAMGPVIAGLSVGVLGWQLLFYINAPVCLLAFVLTMLVVPETRDESAGGRVDWAGFVAVTFAAVLLVLGIERSTGLGWSSSLVWGSLMGFVVVSGVFVWIERAVRDPLVEFGLFRDRDYVIATVIGTIANYVFAAGLFFMTLYLQRVLLLSAVETGLAFIAVTLPFVVFSPLSGRISDAAGPRLPLLVAPVACAAGYGALAAIGPDSGLWLSIVGLVLIGVGQAVSFNVCTLVSMLALPEQKAGIAGGMLMTIRHVGMALGLAISGVIFHALEKASLASQLRAADAPVSSQRLAELRELLSGSPAAREKLAQLSPKVSDHVDAIVDTAFTDGLRGAMLSCVALCAVTWVIAWWVRPAPAKG